MKTTATQEDMRSAAVLTPRRQPRTRKLWLGLLLISAMLVVPAAQAAPPVIVPAPVVDFTDSTSCTFPVALHFTANGETAKIFSDGKIIVTGQLNATLSANGKSVSLNISGPATIYPNGVVIGHGVGVGPVLLPNGQVTLGYSAGVVDITTGTAVP